MVRGEKRYSCIVLIFEELLNEIDNCIYLTEEEIERSKKHIEELKKEINVVENNIKKGYDCYLTSYHFLLLLISSSTTLKGKYKNKHAITFEIPKGTLHYVNRKDGVTKNILNDVRKYNKKIRRIEYVETDKELDEKELRKFISDLRNGFRFFEDYHKKLKKLKKTLTSEEEKLKERMKELKLLREIKEVVNSYANKN